MVTTFSSQTTEGSNLETSIQENESTGASVSIVTTLEVKTTGLSSPDSSIILDTTVDSFTTIAGSTLGSSIPGGSQSHLSTSGESTSGPSTIGASNTEALNTAAETTDGNALIQDE